LVKAAFVHCSGLCGYQAADDRSPKRPPEGKISPLFANVANRLDKSPKNAHPTCKWPRATTFLLAFVCAPTDSRKRGSLRWGRFLI